MKNSNIKNNHFEPLSSKISREIKSSVWSFSKNAFRNVLLLIILDLIIGANILFACVILPKLTMTQGTDKSLIFKGEIYQQIIQDWQTENQNLQIFYQEKTSEGNNLQSF